MRKSFVRGLLGLASVSMFADLAEARILCSSTATSCYFSKMPLYSQNDPSLGYIKNSAGQYLIPFRTATGAVDVNRSMLCAPTAAAMALQGVVSELSSPNNAKAGYYVRDTFMKVTTTMTALQKANHHILSQTNRFPTSPTSGTSLWSMPRGMSQLAGAFLSAGGGFVPHSPNDNLHYMKSITDLIGYIKGSKAAILFKRRNYKRVANVSAGKTYYTYTFTGGDHFVAANGFSGSKLLIYDPWYAQRYERQVVVIKEGCSGTVCQDLPNTTVGRSALYLSGDNFTFIDGHSTLWAN